MNRADTVHDQYKPYKPDSSPLLSLQYKLKATVRRILSDDPGETDREAGNPSATHPFTIAVPAAFVELLLSIAPLSYFVQLSPL